jgi:hypothetical protein
VVVQREIAGGNQIDALIALQLPMAEPQIASKRQ